MFLVRLFVLVHQYIQSIFKFTVGSLVNTKPECIVLKLFIVIFYELECLSLGKPFQPDGMLEIKAVHFRNSTLG